MARMRMPTGEVYEVPDAEVRIAQSKYGAVPDTAGGGPVGGVPVPAQGANPMGTAAGMGASALDAIGGPRTLMVGGAGLAGVAGMKHLMSRGKGGPSKLPAGLVELTEEDIGKFPQLKNYKPGDTIRRPALEAIKLDQQPPPTRTTAKAKGPNPAEARVSAPKKSRQMRGASSPALERRTTARAAATGKNPPAMGDDLEAQLAKSIQAEQMMGKAGVPLLQRPKFRAGLRGVGGAANVLMALLGAADTPEQMAEAVAIARQSRLEGAPPSLQRALTDEEEIY